MFKFIPIFFSSSFYYIFWKKKRIWINYSEILPGWCDWWSIMMTTWIMTPCVSWCLAWKIEDEIQNIVCFFLLSINEFFLSEKLLLHDEKINNLYYFRHFQNLVFLQSINEFFFSENLLLHLHYFQHFQCCHSVYYLF